MSCFPETEAANEEASVLNEESDLRIVLLGKVGVGKSSSGNAILSEELFSSKTSMSAVTMTCQRKEKNVGTQNVVVVDTPGLLNATRSEEEVVMEIKKSISLAKPGPHVFLILLGIGDRYTAEEDNMMEIIINTFGKKTLNYTMVLFTYGDELKDLPIKEFIGSNKKLHKFISTCRYGYHVFDNTKQDGGEQVTELLQKINEKLQTAKPKVYTAVMLKEPEKASQKKKDAEGGGTDSTLTTIRTTAFSGMAIGCLMGYLAGGGQVTSTIAAALGGTAGGILGAAVTGLVILTKDRIMGCTK